MYEVVCEQMTDEVATERTRAIRESPLRYRLRWGRKSLPLEGKVAFAEQMTDEVVTGCKRAIRDSYT